jgi:recombination protein RecA
MASSKPDIPEEITTINKVFGDGSIFLVGDNYRQSVDVIPTGSLELDLALGVGGLALGRVHEIYGPESAGKSTICQHVIAEAQKLGHPVGYIDMEHALDLAYAENCGVDVKNMYISQPDSGEQALEIADKLIHSGKSYVIIVDSVAALVPQAEIEGSMGDSHMGLMARLMSQALRKMSGALKNSNSLILFTNQLRMKIGITYGNPEVTTGGNALKFYATTRMEIRKIETQKSDGVATSNKVKVKVTKNKVAPPFREAIFDIEFGRGINHEGELIDIGAKREIVTKRGAFYSLGDIKLGQGRDRACQYLKENPDLAQSIEVSIRESFKETPMQVAEMAEEEPEGEL